MLDNSSYSVQEEPRSPESPQLPAPSEDLLQAYRLLSSYLLDAGSPINEASDTDSNASDSEKSSDDEVESVGLRKRRVRATVPRTESDLLSNLAERIRKTLENKLVKTE
jgi:hypothetical protein